MSKLRLIRILALTLLFATSNLWAALYPEIGDEIAFRGHRYTVEVGLGAGHYGAVFLVKDTESGQEFALKWYKENLLDELGGRARVESSLQAQIEAPIENVLHAKEAGDAFIFSGPGSRLMVNQNFVALYEVAKGDLRTFAGEFKIAKSRNDNQIRDRIMRVEGLLEALLKGISQMEQRGYGHGDIKPANLLLRYDGSVVIGDTDLLAAKPRGDDLIEGTPVYLSPEIYRLRQERKLRILSDVYSAALTVIELATGENPIQNISKFGLAGSITQLSTFHDLMLFYRSKGAEEVIHAEVAKSFDRIKNRIRNPALKKRTEDLESRLVALLSFDLDKRRAAMKVRSSQQSVEETASTTGECRPVIRRILQFLHIQSY